MDLTTVLRWHAERYPAMEPADAVKLLYQSTFGGGHMIHDVNSSLMRLREEMEQVPYDETAPLTESIGNGFVRVFLTAVPREKGAAELLNGLFVISSQLPGGTKVEFAEKLATLRHLQKDEQLFQFRAEELDEYLRKYAEQGYPAVSHSVTYRERYSPAYRVVSEELLTQLNFKV